VRKFEIILCPLNEHNPTLILKSIVSKGTNLECIGLMAEGFVCQKDQEFFGISALNVKA
jgi:hypothetical protein